MFPEASVWERKMPRTLVTGAAGFIGYHLAVRLADLGHDVVAIDNFQRGSKDELFERLARRGNVATSAFDLARQDVVDKITGDFDFCYHMAALNGTQNFYNQPWSVIWNSTLPTLTMLEALVLTGRCNKFVYAGSGESYAGAVTGFGWAVPTAEDVPLVVLDPRNPRWSYAAAKLHGEVATLSACRQASAACVILRYHNVYGPRMGDKHVVPDFFLRALRGEFYVYGPEQTRSFLYIDDAVDATIKLAETADATNEIVNVGARSEVTIGALAERMMQALGIRAVVEARAVPRGSVARRAPDLSKIYSLIGGYERVSLDDGLARTLGYYKAAAGSFAPGDDGGFERFLEGRGG